MLVVGATGATGRRVVEQLLERNQQVKVMVRSKEKILSLQNSNLTIVESSVLNLSSDELAAHVKDCESVVCCLGHTISFSGMYGKPRYLVRDSISRLCDAVIANGSSKKTKFILMNSNGADNPDGSDPRRSFGDRMVLALVRLLVPPHRDNEASGVYLSKTIGSQNPLVEWVAVRPGNLTDDEHVHPYELTASSPVSAIFGDGSISGPSVAASMVELLTNEETWNTWKFKFPVVLTPKTNQNKDG